ERTRVIKHTHRVTRHSGPVFSALCPQCSQCAIMRFGVLRRDSQRHKGLFESVFAKLLSILIAILVLTLPAAADQTLQAQAGIPPGTTITNRNWQQYRQFMSDGLIALFEGKHFWRVPADVRIEVGPTASIPLPKQYLDDTEKYSGQVAL